MLNNPNWRLDVKNKWKDSKKIGFALSYKDFGRKTTNGFHTILNGSVLENDGSAAKTLERYNPYINSSHDIGHKVRTRMLHRDVSRSEFSTHTSKDIMMKTTMYNSNSIRSIESQSNFQLAREKFKKLSNERYRGSSNMNNFNPAISDYDFNSMEIKKNKRGSISKYQPNVNRLNSRSTEIDLPLIQVSSTLNDKLLS
jgi:hypothetical protein